MKINNFSSFNTKYSSYNKNSFHSNLKTINNNQVLNYPFEYSNFLPFKGFIKPPLTEHDYKQAKEYLNSVINTDSTNLFYLNELDLDKLNGIQKGIKVFDGLSMKDINFILNTRKTFLLLNRGCNNNCSHCAYMANPITNKTYDRISYEDFNSLVDGIIELRQRMDNKVSFNFGLGTFLDSDCMNIELSDKNGKIYDYIDCLDILDKLDSTPPCFDTSGWNPESEMHQKRAEKFVNFIIQPKNNKKVHTINISINPYHGLYAKSAEAAKKLQFEKAKNYKDMYTKRMANVLYTFTPLLNTNIYIGVLTRAIPHKNTKSGCDDKALRTIKKDTYKELKKMYLKDVDCSIKSREDMEKYLNSWSSLLFSDDYYNKIAPLGRAQELFIDSGDNNLDKRINSALKYAKTSPCDLEKAINPNGQVILICNDVSIKTNLGLNFENKDKETKPFANQVDDYIFNLES